MAAGSIHPKSRVSFANLPREGVLDVLGRWIEDEWLRLEMGGRERECAGREQGQPRWLSIAGGDELAGMVG